MALISTTQDLFPQITRLQKQYSTPCCRIRKSSTIGCWILDNQLPLIAYRSVQCSRYKEMMKKHAIKDKGIALRYNKLEAAYRHDTSSKTGSFITRIMALKVFTQRIRWNNRNLYLQLGKSVLSVKWQPLSMQDKSVKLHYLVILIQFILSCTLLSNPSASATDALKTCTCLLKECRVELARCITDPACAANVACLNACNNRPDEIECQIKCGDLFENTVVDQFNECAVSRKKCVSRKSDEGTYPIPEPAALVKNFNLSDFVGKWYISSGLNPSFDTFDCQVHEFNVSEGRLNVNLTWRISTPDGGFFTRSTMQKFIQDSSNPGILYNHDNEYLHYQDDWYILSSKIENTADDYVFVYYHGSNDAWDGYGGAVVYTRSPFLPSTIVPELENAARKVGLDFSRFRKTDNTCGPEPPLLARIEKKVIEGEQAIAKEVEEIEETVEETVEKVENTEMNFLERLGKGFEELRKDEDNFLKGLNEEEKELLGSLKMEAEQVEKLFGKSLPLRKLR